MVTPAAWNFGARICMKFQYEGIDSGRCVSLARIGLPLRVLLPAMAQLLEAAMPAGVRAARGCVARSSAASPGTLPPSFKPLSLSTSSNGNTSSG